MLSVAAPTLRPARFGDTGAVLALLEAEKLEALFEPREFMVAEIDGRVVACARLKRLPDGAAELASVAVAPELRGRGVGARLVSALLARADGPVHALALAPGFFARLGFRETDALPASLREKAEGTCSSSGFVRMVWEPGAMPVRERYATIARAATGGCCGKTGAAEAGLPPEADLGLGTGDVVAAAAPRPGEVVVDLGSGPGGDVLRAARAVGPGGRAIGVDFTPEMVALARANAREAGLPNAEFVEGPIDRLPLPGASADVVLSNCVVNLAPDKVAALREARRVLRDGGRLAISDTLRVWPAEACEDACGCTAGALSEPEWRAALDAAGFRDVRIEASEPDGRFGPAVGTVLIRALR